MWRAHELAEYGAEMPTVYLRADPKKRGRFHRDPECFQLQKKPAQGEHNPLVAMDLEDVYVRPCLSCYPDAPHLKITKRYCPICETRYACPHNGGEPVLLDYDDYHKTERLWWVWPDHNRIRWFHRER